MSAASIVVSIGRSDFLASFSVELDDKRNNGRTTFLPGEVCYLLIDGAADLNLELHASSGSAELDGERLDEYTETITFVDSDEAPLSYPAESLTVCRPYRTSSAEVAASEELALIDPQTVRLKDGVPPRILEISYLRKRRQAKLHIDPSILVRPGETFKVLVVVKEA